MRPPRSWWAPLVNEGIFHLQLMRAGRALRRARLAAYKSDRRRRGSFFFTFALSVCCPWLPRSSPRAVLAFAPLLLEPFLPPVPRPPTRSYGPPTAHHHHRPAVLTDKTSIHLRSASVRTYTFFTTGFPKFLSIRGARGLLALNQVLI
jgi:hypothetical protein